MRRAALVWLACGALLSAGCAGDDAEPESFARVPDTVGLGALPDPVTPDVADVAPPMAPPTTPPPTIVEEVEIEPIEGQIGDVVDSDRLLLIGDSAMTTLTERHDGIGCDVLNELGWDVEIEAEMARYLPFADEVIAEVVVDQGEDWDAIGLMFGHFLDTSVEEFGTELVRIIDELSPRPILLYTVTQDGDATAAELNDTIREIGEETPNVVVVDWGAAVAFEEIVDLTDDNGLPNEEGMGRIVLLTAAALGDAPGGGVGLCLDPRFTDDSAIVIDS
jgi:hypothetical protein